MTTTTGLDRLAEQIESLPETDEPTTTPTNRCVLLERLTAGILVQITYMTDTEDEVWLDVTVNNVTDSVMIEPTKCFDAFDHPYCYLPA